MPAKRDFYNQETGEKLTRFALDARECVRRDPELYGWKPPAKKPSGVSARDDKAARAAKAKAKAADPFDHDGDGKPGGSLPMAERGPAEETEAAS